MADSGWDVLLGIARFWSQRITWSEEKQQYVMLGVTGPNEYDGKFFGVTAGGEDVAINICGAGAAEFHKTTMDRVNDRKPYYKFRKNVSYVLNNVRCVQSVNVSPTEVVKKLEGKPRDVLNYFEDRKSVV
jgi:hypothetical protein